MRRPLHRHHPPQRESCPPTARTPVLNSRARAACVIQRVLEGQSLTAALQALPAPISSADRTFIHALCYGTVRWQPRLQALLRTALHRPDLALADQVQTLLWIGLYQLLYLRVPPYAAISETVTAAQQLGHDCASGLINGLLRTFLRQRDTFYARIAANPVAQTAHPAWWLACLQRDWPQQWQTLVEANNAHPPMTLRVNPQRLDRETYLAHLHARGIAATPLAVNPVGIVLNEPQPLEKLPGFYEGWVSVQDGAAQLVAPLLDPQPRHRILDACAAPGGKTGHILEIQPTVELTALDIDEARLRQVKDMLERLQLKATTCLGDLTEPHPSWACGSYDRILLDAPCSGSGVIRRHPDIKLLRRPSDIAALAERQLSLLNAAWPLLKPAGRLVYTVCSILREETDAVIHRFLAQQPEACVLPIHAAWGWAGQSGRYLLTGEQTMDGFYYAVLGRATNATGA